MPLRQRGSRWNRAWFLLPALAWLRRVLPAAGLAPLTAAPAGALGKVIMIDITVATISGIDPLRYALRSSVDDTRAKTDNDAMRHAKRVSGLARHFTQGGNRVCLHFFLQLNQALSPICTMLMQLFRQLNQILISIFILLLTLVTHFSRCCKYVAWMLRVVLSRALLGTLTGSKSASFWMTRECLQNLQLGSCG